MADVINISNLFYGAVALMRNIKILDPKKASEDYLDQATERLQIQMYLATNALLMNKKPRKIDVATIYNVVADQIQYFLRARPTYDNDEFNLFLEAITYGFERDLKLTILNAITVFRRDTIL